jgi:geranylgeranyl pyrophosphate synthase
MALTMERLWPALGIAKDSPEAKAVDSALLEPARSMLARAGKRFRGHLVELSWRLAGGTHPCPPALPGVIEVIHAGSLIVDDIEDGSPERRGAPTVHRIFGTSLALNAGNWLYFQALELLRELELPAEVELDLHRRLGRMLVQGHAGQALDLDTRITRLSQEAVGQHVATMSRLKTGSFMGLAAAVGAVAAQAPRPLADAVEDFGLALGAGLQMLDDLGNLVGRKDESKRWEDLIHARATWPWAWLAEVASADEWRDMIALQARVLSGESEAGVLARDLLNRVGLPGRQRVHSLLSGAFDDLRLVTGPHPLLSTLRAEMERLESSYV